MGNTKQAFTEFAGKHPELFFGGLGAASAGTAAGINHAAGGFDARIKSLAKAKGVKKEDMPKFRRKEVAKNYARAIGVGAGMGAMSGFSQRLLGKIINKAHEHAFGGNRSYYYDHFRQHAGRAAPKPTMHHRDAMRFLGIKGDEMTKAEARKKFLRHAAKHHPDVGGDENMMKKVNEAWESVQNSGWFKKLSAPRFWLGFLKESVSKEDLVEVLKKHEARETPAQEAEESDKEQKIEEAAGIHDKEAAEKKKKKKKKCPGQEVIMFHGHYAAPSCNHHKVLHTVAKKHGITPRVVDVEKDHKETAHHKVRNVPHVVFQRDGKTVGQYTGDRPESHVSAFFQSHVTPETGETPGP